MKAVSLVGPKSFRKIPDYPEPDQLGPGEVLLRVKTVGICGSDLHLYKDGRIGNIGVGKEVVLGHEFMGEALAVGECARDGFNRMLYPGQRVAVDPHIACLKCEWCLRGDVNLCPHHIFIGLPGADGALRERLNVAARNCFPIPAELGAAAGALLEPLGVAIHAVDLAKPSPGRIAAVIGCGPIGLMTVRLCSIAGMNTIVAMDPRPARLDLARRWGATHIFQGPAEEKTAEALEATGRRGFDLVFECAWAGAAISAAARIAAPGGKILLVGIPEDDTCGFPHSFARRKGLSLIFVRRMKHTYPRAIELASGANPAIPLDDLVTHRFSLDETPRAFAMNAAYEDNIIKAVIEM